MAWAQPRAEGGAGLQNAAVAGYNGRRSALQIRRVQELCLGVTSAMGRSPSELITVAYANLVSSNMTIIVQ
ncbi:hypothetical protein RhiXN_00896 [Rhizoctonia solani]|uniref:Uncharacterized protein n=1 Tax=Rhizoctonia solani TaxID=456999 RepID=A0A8H8NUC6_9AGAM|nr:uncharacterized protein RhiXN_00896 [Rhizoctonia solani]QRW19490.1 hypothetical protein RhiXN_00896 [Rhizoctonia solani]